MEKVTKIVVEYEPSDTIEVQGKRDKIEKYLKKGYSVKEERNGYWVLIKKAKVWVTLTNSYCTKTFSIKADILDYYSKKKIHMQYPIIALSRLSHKPTTCKNDYTTKLICYS